MTFRHRCFAGLAVAAMVASWGCGAKEKNDAAKGSTAKKTTNAILVEGSDTMVNLAQAWAETYHKEHPEISVPVLGGGSGVGIASLIDGKCDLANASRKMSDKEIKKATDNRGAEPVEHIVGYDALAIYVHKDNPLASISMEQLAEIYGKGGELTEWSQLGVAADAKIAGKIIRVSRQSSSGTYVFFREHILGTKRDYKQGSIDENGSKDVVALVSKTPSAIGYSGMGYKTDDVKTLTVSAKTGGPAVAPTLENAKAGTYPITRPLQIYSVGPPTGIIKDYLDWIKLPAGQKVVVEMGYVPVQ